MKRLIRCYTEPTYEMEELAISTFGRDHPDTGCSFISPDGTFVNIYPKLAIHEDLCDWVEEQLGAELEYKDEEYFVREYSWIRLRSDPSMIVIELPAEYLFSKQWYSLEDWLIWCEEKYSGRIVPVYLNICDDIVNTNVEYDTSSPTWVDDIMKILKQSYRSGKVW